VPTYGVDSVKGPDTAIVGLAAIVGGRDCVEPPCGVDASTASLRVNVDRSEKVTALR
jgi:hypothetical protein